MSLAEFGRKELTLAEVEMPGLMETRKEFGAAQPLKGVEISGSLHMTIQTGVLSETLEEYWWCTEQMLTWPNGKGPQMIVDDGGDATMLIHEGVKAEALFAKDGTLPDPASTTNTEFKCVLNIIKNSIPKDGQK